MLLLPECKMTFVCGPVASGKTHLLKRWTANDNRHVIFDSTGEYMDDQNHEEIWANPRALWERVRNNPYYFRIVYVPGRDRNADFAHVLNALWWRNTPKLLVCDEVADLCSVDYVDEDVERILRFARKDKMGFLTASQRIADVSKLFTGGCRMVVLFQTHEARDLDAIEDRWRCASEVERLRPLLYDDMTNTTHQIPQCVVCEKGKAPYVYDFATENAVPSIAEDEDSPQRETEEVSELLNPRTGRPYITRSPSEEIEDEDEDPIHRSETSPERV
jgi:hypothetical protein